MKPQPRTAFAGLIVGAMAIASTAAAAQDSGRALYVQHCLTCHGADGAGLMPGVPELTDPAGVLAKADTLLLRSLLDGVQRPGAPLAMPPRGGNPALTPQDLQAVLAFLRREFNVRPGPTTGDR